MPKPLITGQMIADNVGKIEMEINSLFLMVPVMIEDRSR